MYAPQNAPIVPKKNIPLPTERNNWLEYVYIRVYMHNNKGDKRVTHQREGLITTDDLIF